MTIQPLIGSNGRLPILIRDDDTNFFTDPKMLESIYSEAWSEGFKVSLSVIPCQSGIDDLCVPPRQRKTGLSYSIADNQPLIRYLKGKVLRGEVEILQHGLHHKFNDFRRGEFSSGLRSGNSILNGRDIIEGALGKQPRFFVPPGEDISNDNLKLINQLGMIPIYRNTSFDRFMRSSLFPNSLKKISFELIMWAYSKFYLQDLVLSLMKPVIISPALGLLKWSLPSNKLGKFRNSEGLLQYTKDIINSCIISRAPLCILSHYHSYYYDWNPTISRSELFRTWIEITRSFRDVEFSWKTDFSNLYDRFLKVNQVKINQTGSKIAIKTGEEVTDYSFICSSPIEQNPIANYDKDTKICTIQSIRPELLSTIYLKD